MRIAMMTNNYKPFIGGVPISIERLSNGLRELGHEVYIFAPTYENQVEEEYVVRFKSFKHNISKGKFVVPNILDSSLEEQFRVLNIDMIHVHHPMLVGWSALYLGKRYKIPVTFTYHTRFEQYIHHLKTFNYMENVYKYEELSLKAELCSFILDFTKEKLIPKTIKCFANKCDNIIAPTNLMEDYLRGFGVRSNIDILPTGLEETSYIYNSESLKIRERYKGDKKYLMCTVSRLAKEKNIDFIVDGISLLKNKVGNCFKVLIIGDGPSKEELLDKVVDLNLRDNIEFLNSIPNEEIQKYYAASDIFLFASKSETQGIVLLEAMAAKKPVVAIEASGVVDIVKENINGYMTEENIEQWVERIMYLMRNKEEMERLKNGAYETAKCYSNEKIAKLAERSYEKAIQRYCSESREYRLYESINIR